MSFGIQNIAVGLPQTRLTPDQLGFGLNENYYSNISGAKYLYRAGPNEGAFELCKKAAESLLLSDPEAFSDLDAIFVVTLPTEPTVAPISARMQSVLKASNSVFCLDLTLSCVGFLQASSVLLNMMEMRRWKKAALFNAETLCKIIAKEDKALQLVFSDVATVSLFTEKPKIRLENFEFGVDGDLACLLEARNKIMFMDGPKLYETVLKKVPASFSSALQRFGFEEKQIDYFAFHQASRKVLDKLSEQLCLDRERLLENIGEVGNTGSCSIPYLLSDLLLRPHAAEKLIYCTAFGAGFQWAHALARLERNG